MNNRKYSSPWQGHVPPLLIAILVVTFIIGTALWLMTSSGKTIS